jgi:hypothetical protein
MLGDLRVEQPPTVTNLKRPGWAWTRDNGYRLVGWAETVCTSIRASLQSQKTAFLSVRPL